MQAHLLVLIGVAAVALPACGSDEPGAGETAAAPIAGMYEVTGETVTKATGDKRGISGKIIIAESEDGTGYTATFNLTTTYPGAEEALPAEVIGKGEGSIDGRSLVGSAQTQLVMATVPGVDPGFAFVPRMVSTRIVSKSNATVAADGSVQIQIENEPAPGETYAPTRTSLSGFRVSSTDVLEGVATRSPARE
jgi:hypothetical protein